MCKRLLTYCMIVWMVMSACFPFQDTEEVSKLPLLWHHYVSHHAGSSFFNFLVEHYVKLNHTHQDQGDLEHQKLPMKVHQHEGLQIFFFMPSGGVGRFESPTAISVVSCFASGSGSPRHIARFVFHPPCRA